MARISVLLFAVSVSLSACGGEVSVRAPEEHDSSPDPHPDAEVSPGTDSSARDALPARDGADAPDADPAHDAPEEIVSELEAEASVDVQLDSSVATDSAADGAQTDSTVEPDAPPGIDVESEDATAVDSESGDGDADSGSVVCDTGCFDAGTDDAEFEAGQMDACAPPGCIALYCSTGLGNMVLECGDCADNDGDGLIDMADPDCLGPCDFSETDFRPPPGSPSTPCPQDCYYDLTYSSGDDTCHWDHRCGPLAKQVPALPYPYCKYKPELEPQCQLWLSEQSATCHDRCETITPNGCDCFGCCEHPAGSGNFLWLGSFSFEYNSQQCRMAVIDDPFYCHPCTPVPSCMNPCEGCELCFGMTALPPGCDQQQCPSGSQPCGLPCQPLCPATQFCLTGCCTSLPPM